jgi:hypothetical protein
MARTKRTLDWRDALMVPGQETGYAARVATTRAIAGLGPHRLSYSKARLLRVFLLLCCFCVRLLRVCLLLFCFFVLLFCFFVLLLRLSRWLRSGVY